MWGVLFLFCTLAASAILEDSFSNIESNPGTGIVIFYRSSNKDALGLIKKLSKVSEQMSKEFPQFTFRKCDGDLQVNRKSFASASFGSNPYIFTSTPGEGIVKFVGPRSVASVRALVRSKFANGDKQDLATFTGEHDFWDLMDLDDIPKPTFVFFHNKQDKCPTCSRIRVGTPRLATAVKGQVNVMEVDCSDDAKFCDTHQVDTFPTFILFSGERKVEMSMPKNVDVPGLYLFQRFFKQEVPGYRHVKLGPGGRYKYRAMSISSNTPRVVKSAAANAAPATAAGNAAPTTPLNLAEALVQINALKQDLTKAEEVIAKLKQEKQELRQEIKRQSRSIN